jgi:N-dimethylarginine dimethylaminohydrolase
MSSIRLCVTHEWARLREVIVGRPFYRIPKPFPETYREEVSDAVWRKVKAREGQTMEASMPQDYARCAAQMAAVIRLLEDRGVEVHRVPEFAPGEEDYLAAIHPEAIQFFPRDPILVAGDRIVELCLRDGRRRRERAPLRRLLQDLGAIVPPRFRSMDFPDSSKGDGETWPYLEGGDCLVVGTEVLVGIRNRGSNSAGVDWLQKALGTPHRVSPVPLSSDFAHLDLALGLIRPGLGILCREALPEGLPSFLQDWDWIEISREEALVAMAANGMPLDARTLLLPAQTDRVARALAKRGCEVIAIPFDTVTAFNGGLRCWSQPLARWD